MQRLELMHKAVGFARFKPESFIGTRDKDALNYNIAQILQSRADVADRLLRVSLIDSPQFTELNAMYNHHNELLKTLLA